MCSTTSGETISMGGQNIGDLLNEKGVSWGWFEGGFNLQGGNANSNPNGSTGCNRSHFSYVTNSTKADYIPHHEPFQYYASTANPKHLRPSSPQAIGITDQANHQYDIDDWYSAVQNGNLPAVSFLKASGYQDAHAGYSDPLDEQSMIVTVINWLQQYNQFSDTAVFIAYDDSDGWYDHQMSPIVNQSATSADALTAIGQCGTGTNALASPTALHAQGRCGYGPRQPLLLISPYAKQNYVDHTITDQTSIIHFIEDNWLQGERIGNGSFDAISGTVNNMFDFVHPNFTPYILDKNTGLVTAQ
jgi:phospholipase C